MLRPIYTEPENCQDCYKCVRECPVKAINVEGNKASIEEERCIYCGHCTQVCPTGAKKIRDGLTRARLTVERYPRKVYLSLAPSYASEFGDVSTTVLIAAVQQLGFAGVSETALGAEMVSAATERFLTQAPEGVYISSACPVAVAYIQKYAPVHASKITPIFSPMLAHAKLLKDNYGQDIRVIFAGPCIGKKSEADNYNRLIDVAITFADLRRWLDREGIDLEMPIQPESAAFIPYPSGQGSMYPIEGGMLASMHPLPRPVHYMAFSSLPSIRDALNNIDSYCFGQTVFLELLACRGGCINGPAKLHDGSLAVKHHTIRHTCVQENPRRDSTHIDLNAQFAPDPQKTSCEYTEDELKEALSVVGKTTPEDELNCSSCGYDSCRDFAVAMLEGHAEDSMCASYMRRIAHDKATALLHKIPAGVLLVNKALSVVDMNRSFAQAMGPEILELYEVCPGIPGAALKSVCSNFESLFRTALVTGEEIRERKVKENGKTWLLSIYNMQPHRLVFGLLQDLQEPSVRKDWMLEKTQEVIKNHMATVQKIAGLLGENAAFTDASLRSIIEAYNKPEDKAKM